MENIQKSYIVEMLPSHNSQNKREIKVTLCRDDTTSPPDLITLFILGTVTHLLFHMNINMLCNQKKCEYFPVLLFVNYYIRNIHHILIVLIVIISPSFHA